MAKGGFQVRRLGNQGVDAVIADSAHPFARHTHDQFGIGMVVRGAQRSLSERGMVEAQAGDIITVNPNEVHDGIPIGDQGRTWRMLYFDPDLVARTALDMTEGRTGDVVLSAPVVRDTRVAALFEALFVAMSAPLPGEESMRRDERLALLLAQLVTPNAEALRLTAAPAEILLAKALIDDDPAAPLTLADLAAASGLSRFQLVRGFARTTGLTPHAYLIQRRLQTARRLIARGTSLADAAFAAGFADQSHMTRLFVHTYGTSPGVYASATT